MNYLILTLILLICLTVLLYVSHRNNTKSAERVEPTRLNPEFLVRLRHISKVSYAYKLGLRNGRAAKVVKMYGTVFVKTSYRSEQLLEVHSIIAGTDYHKLIAYKGYLWVETPAVNFVRFLANKVVHK